MKTGVHVQWAKIAVNSRNYLKHIQTGLPQFDRIFCQILMLFIIQCMQVDILVPINEKIYLSRQGEVYHARGLELKFKKT